MSPLLKGQDVTGDYDVKSLLPDALFFLNVSVLTIRDPKKQTDVIEWIKKLSADGIVIHLNVLQELIQPEGERDFSGSIEAIKQLRSAYTGKIIVKEVGVGIEKKSAELLSSIGIDAIECAAQGGTSWSWIEGERGKDSRGQTFKDFGLPTPLLLQDLKGMKLPIIGSGGVRNGLDVAKVLALGGSVAGMARALLLSAMEPSDESVVHAFEQIVLDLKTAMVVSGAANIDALKKVSIRPRA